MATFKNRAFTSVGGINLNSRNGVIRFETPTDEPSVATGEYYLFVNSSKELIYQDGSSATIIGGIGGGGTPTWETLFAADATFTITPDTTWTIAGNRSTATDVVTITNVAGGSGDCIKITNSGTGKDISGSSDNWSVTKAGLAVVVGLTTTSDFTSTGAAIDWDLIDNNASALSFDTTGQAGILEIVTTNAGEGVKMATTCAVTGLLSALGASNTVSNLVVTNNTITTFGADADSAGMVVIRSTSLTTGALLQLQYDESAMVGGFLIVGRGTDDGTNDYTVGENGVTVIRGTVDSDSFTLTSGDINIGDGSITLVDTDTATALSITADSVTSQDAIFVSVDGLTSGSAMKIESSGTMTGAGALIELVADSATSAAGVFRISVDGLVDGKAILVDQTGEALTSGELFTITNTESGDLATITGNLCSITSSLDETAGTIIADYDMLLLSRIDKQSFNAQYDAQGSVLKIEKTQNKVTGSMIDDVIALEIISVSTNGAVILGDSVKITSVGVNERSLNIINACTGKDAVLITATGALTNGLAGVHIKTTGDLATGGANLILTLSGTSVNAGARAFEIDAQKDCYAAYIDTDAVTNDAFYITHSGNLASAKGVLTVTDAGIPAADDTCVIRAAFTGTDTKESRIISAEGTGKDVIGLFVDTDNTIAANSANIVVYNNTDGAVGPSIVAHHESSTPAADDQLLFIGAYGEETTSSDTMIYAQMTYEIEAATDGAIRGQIRLGVADGSSGASNIRESFILSDDTLQLGDSATFTLGSNGSYNLEISTAITTGGLVADEPKIVLTDGNAGDITFTAGAITAGHLAMKSAMTKSSNVGLTANVTQSQGQSPQTADIIEISISGNSGDVITLPDVKAGKMCYYINRGVQQADIFPASGDNINETGVNTAKALAANAGILFIGIDDTHWEAWTQAR